MKKFLLILSIAFTAVACSSDEAAEDKYPQHHNVTFSVVSSDLSRFSEIEVDIEGKGIDVRSSSYSNVHLPFVRNYTNQVIPEFTNLGISYRDNSGGAVGEAFEPYTVKLTISVDSEIKAEEEFQITESGFVGSADYIFN